MNTKKANIVVNVKRKNVGDLFDFVNSHLTLMENCSSEFIVEEHRESDRIVLPKPKHKSGAEYLAKFLPAMENCSAEEVFQCPICIDEVLVNEVIRRLRCGHAFHSFCIDKWLDDKRDDLACPICRTSGYEGE